MTSKYIKNQLVLSGCSMVSDYVTYKNRISKNGKIKQPVNNKEGGFFYWKVLEPWPTIDVHVAKAFENVPVNLAIPGAANERIFKQTVKYIMENYSKIDRLVVCWTLFGRYDIQLRPGKYEVGHASTSIHPPSYDINDPKLNKEGSPMLPPYKKIWKEMHGIGAIHPIIDIDNFFLWNGIIRELCYLYDIKLYQCSSIRNNYENDNSIDKLAAYKRILEHPGYDEIEKIYYGWPIHPMIGGTALFEKFKEDDCISKYDMHPSNKAVIVGANKLIEFIKACDGKHT